jgi:hypothetical protein
VGVVVMEVGGVARRLGGKVLAGEVERERGRRDLRGRRKRDCICGLDYVVQDPTGAQWPVAVAWRCGKWQDDNGKFKVLLKV